LTTPAGKPASLVRAAIARAVKGVCSAGWKLKILIQVYAINIILALTFKTTVLPHAKAGPNFQASIMIG
jgi:hypothetical protein